MLAAERLPTYSGPQELPKRFPPPIDTKELINNRQHELAGQLEKTQDLPHIAFIDGKPYRKNQALSHLRDAINDMNSVLGFLKEDDATSANNYIDERLKEVSPQFDEVRDFTSAVIVKNGKVLGRDQYFNELRDTRNWLFTMKGSISKEDTSIIIEKNKPTILPHRKHPKRKIK